MATEIVYTNESTKKFEAILFADGQSPSIQSIAWFVFKDKNIKTSIPQETSLEFHYTSQTGKSCTLRPLTTSTVYAWIIEENERGEIKLTEGDNTSPSPTTNIQVTNNSSLSGRIALYKCQRLFLSCHIKPHGESFNFPIYNNIYFGLSKTAIKQGDVVSLKENNFSPLAKLEMSFLGEGGVKIDVSDNPAGRPHVVVDRISCQ